MGGSSVRGPVDHVPLFGGRGDVRPRPLTPSTRKWILGEGLGGGWAQGGGALLGSAHPTPSTRKWIWGGEGGSSLRGHVDHVPLFGWVGGSKGWGVIRPRPPTPSTRKWILGEGLGGGGRKGEGRC